MVGFRRHPQLHDTSQVEVQAWTVLPVASSIA